MAEVTRRLMGPGHAPDEMLADILAGAWLSALLLGLLHLPAAF